MIVNAVNLRNIYIIFAALRKRPNEQSECDLEKPTIFQIGRFRHTKCKKII